MRPRHVKSEWDRVCLDAMTEKVPGRRAFRIRGLKTEECPFTNLHETRKARWGEAMTAEKMKECIWVRPELVAQIEFLEWTDADHLRHSKFVGLREDKDPRCVVKEIS